MNTSMSHEPVYIEIPEQRTFKIGSFLANHAVLVFLFASIFLSAFAPLPLYLGFAVLAFGLMLLGYRLVKTTRPLVREKLASELAKQTDMSLPSDFDPQALPKKGVVSKKVLVTDDQGVTTEWTAARNGTFFRFAPAS